MLLLAAGLALRWAPAVPAALALLGAEYAAYLAVDEPGLDLSAPVFGAGLLAAAELAYWSLETRAAVTPEPGTRARRAAWILALAFGGMLVGALVLALVDVTRTEGLAVEAVGAAAALAAVGLVWWWVRAALAEERD